MLLSLFALAGAFLSAGPATATELSPIRAEKPAFALDTLAGARVELAAQRGRMVLVHFFATWCEPCRDEIASLQRLHQRAAGFVRILALDVAEPDDRVRRFFATIKADFPILLDRDKAVTKAWGVDTLPTTFILDPNLTPRLIAEGDYDWDRPHTDQTLSKLREEKP